MKHILLFLPSIICATYDIAWQQHLGNFNGQILSGITSSDIIIHTYDMMIIINNNNGTTTTTHTNTSLHHLSSSAGIGSC